MRSLPLSVKEYLILQKVKPCQSGDMCVLRSLMKIPRARACRLGRAINELTLVLGPDVELAVLPDNAAFLIVSIAINEVRNFNVMKFDFHLDIFLINSLVYAVLATPLFTK